MTFDVGFALKAIPEILSAVPTALQMTLIATIAGLALGFVLAFCRIYHIRGLYSLSGAMLSLLKGIPLMIQLYIAYYGIPFTLSKVAAQMGHKIDLTHISPFSIAVTALALNYAAYFAEMIRSAVQAVDPGQMEAACSIGFTTVGAMCRIVLPQAALIALPNFGNLFISIFKATSLTYAISIIEIMGKARILANDNFNYIEAYFVATCIYWMINIIFEKVIRISEKHLSTETAA